MNFAVADYPLAARQLRGLVDGRPRELSLDLGGVGLVAVDIDGDDDARLLGCRLEHRPHLGGLFKVVGGADNRLARGLNKSVELTGEVARLGLVAGHRPYRCQISGAGLGSADRTQNTGSVDTVGVPEPGGGKWFLGFFASGGVDGGECLDCVLPRLELDRECLGFTGGEELP